MKRKSLVLTCMTAIGTLLAPVGASADPKADCAEWCAQHEECKMCSPMRNLGGPFERIRDFRGRGKNYHAFRESPAAFNRQACKEWCDNEASCEKCSTHPGCGRGYGPLRTFRGPGHNYYACSKNNRGAAGDINKRECEAWCGRNDECTKCSNRPGCGRGYKRIKKFGGRGANWHARHKR